MQCMRASLAILVLLFTDAASSQERPSRHRPTNYSIRRFVTTPQRLWTYKASRAGRISCQFNQMRTSSPLEIFYNRTFLFRRGRHSISLRGEFDAQHRNRMDVRTDDLQQTFLSRETLLYLADKASCGVLKIETIDRGVYYELRVLNDYVETIPDHGCRSHFFRFARTGRLIYSPECQHLVKPRK
uniref:Putative group i salivary lipocalin n=1 Tax=Rhipicephalus pulchellus TaxID=72859 RepID=L7LSS4_RHIPC